MNNKKIVSYKIRLALTVTLVLYSFASTAYATFERQSSPHKDVLIIWDEDRQSYDAIDVATSAHLFTRKLDKGCWWELIPSSTSIVCTDTAGNEYLLDITTEERRKIPLTNVELLGWNTVGRHLAYQNKDGTNSRDFFINDSLFIYDIVSNLVLTYTIPAFLRGEISSTELRLSQSGDYMALMTDQRGSSSWSIFKLSNKSISKVRDYGSISEPISNDFEWSSISLQFVFGVTPTGQDAFVPADRIFLGRIQSGSKRLISRSTSELSYWGRSIEWSPTAEQLVVGVWDATFESNPLACVINITTKTQRCNQAKPGVNGQFATWSPSGKKLAFVDLQSKIRIVSTTFSNSQKLSVSVPNNFAIYWRHHPLKS